MKGSNIDVVVVRYYKYNCKAVVRIKTPYDEGVLNCKFERMLNYNKITLPWLDCEGSSIIALRDAFSRYLLDIGLLRFSEYGYAFPSYMGVDALKLYSTLSCSGNVTEKTYHNVCQIVDSYTPGPGHRVKGEYLVVYDDDGNYAIAIESYYPIRLIYREGYGVLYDAHPIVNAEYINPHLKLAKRLYMQHANFTPKDTFACHTNNFEWYDVLSHLKPV